MKVKSKQDPCPSTAFYKDNVKWTFFTYPNGKQEEAGEFASRELANRAAFFAHQMWQAIGNSYGPLKVRVRGQA